jgi:hypothetical protein
MGSQFGKNSENLARQIENFSLTQQPFNASRLLPPINEMIKQSKKQTSVLCYMKSVLTGFCRFAHGKKALRQNMVSSRTDFAPPPYAFLINEKGKRALTKKRYKTILAHADKYDIFINGFTKEVCHNSKKGELLTDTEYIMIKTYMETGKPLAPFQVTGYVREYKKTEQDLAWNDKKLHEVWEKNDTIDDDEWKLLRNSSEISEDSLRRFERSAIKIFESARRKVDIKENRGFIHFPQVQRKGRDRIAKYQFKPENLAYCLIIPS